MYYYSLEGLFYSGRSFLYTTDPPDTQRSGKIISYLGEHRDNHPAFLVSVSGVMQIIICPGVPKFTFFNTEEELISYLGTTDAS